MNSAGCVISNPPYIRTIWQRFTVITDLWFCQVNLGNSSDLFYLCSKTQKIIMSIKNFFVEIKQMSWIFFWVKFFKKSFLLVFFFRKVLPYKTKKNILIMMGDGSFSHNYEFFWFINNHDMTLKQCCQVVILKQGCQVFTGIIFSKVWSVKHLFLYMNVNVHSLFFISTWPIKHMKAFFSKKLST